MDGRCANWDHPDWIFATGMANENNDRGWGGKSTADCRQECMDRKECTYYVRYYSVQKRLLIYMPKHHQDKRRSKVTVFQDFCVACLLAHLEKQLQLV